MGMLKSSDREQSAGQQAALIAALKERGLPTYMATHLLEKMMADEDAIVAAERIAARSAGR